MEFVSDNLFTEGKLRILTIVDAYTRESPLIEVRYKYTDYDIANSLLDRTISLYRLPRVIKVDNGPEFILKHLSSFLGPPLFKIFAE